MTRRRDPPRARAQSLDELSAIRKALHAEREQARARAAAREQQQRESTLFARAVGPVRPLRTHERVISRAPAPEPRARQRELDERAALHESLSDEFDPATLLQTDSELSWSQRGVGPDVTARLRRGHWSVQAELDLHGLRSDEAREALLTFLHEAARLGLRCVRVIHGKGLGSPGRTPVLKSKVRRWLAQKPQVLAFVQARQAQGGAGAVVVLLEAATRRNRQEAGSRAGSPPTGDH